MPSKARSSVSREEASAPRSLQPHPDPEGHLRRAETLGGAGAPYPDYLRGLESAAGYRAVDRLRAPSALQRRGAVAVRATPSQGLLQRFGEIRFANLDEDKEQYVEKSEAIIATLRNAPNIQAFIANKNVLITLESEGILGTPASVTVKDTQVQVKIAPWFFEQESRGKIVGMLAHEFGIHPLADENLTALDKQNEQHAVQNRTALQTGVPHETIAYEDGVQADHIFGSVEGQPRFEQYRQTIYDMAAGMMTAQGQNHALHITNAHITDAILSYLADLATILSTNDHRLRVRNNYARAAQFFNHAKARWLVYLQGINTATSQALVNLTPVDQTAETVKSQVWSLAGSRALAIFTSSTSSAKGKQTKPSLFGNYTETTTNQQEVLADHQLALQPKAFGHVRPTFFSTVDAARGVVDGSSAVAVRAQLRQWVLSHEQAVQNGNQPAHDLLEPETLRSFGTFIERLTANYYTGEVPDYLVYLTALAVGEKIVVIAPDGQMKVDDRAQNGPRYLLYIPKPDPHYRFSQ